MVILTGCRGLIGTLISSHLHEKGIPYIGLDKHNCDLSSSDAINSLFQTHASYSVLINCFALNDHVDKERSQADQDHSYLCSKDELSKYLEINVAALYDVCSTFIHTREFGRIINFSSIYGLVSPNPALYVGISPKSPGYSVSKGAVHSLTQHLSAHSAPNFLVNTLTIGGIAYQQGEDFKGRYSQLLPLQRMMEMHEVLPAIDFLMNKNNTYMTGANLVLDGGYTSL